MSRLERSGGDWECWFVFSHLLTSHRIHSSREIQSSHTASYDAVCKFSDTAPESDCTRDKDWTGARTGGKLGITNLQNRTEFQYTWTTSWYSWWCGLLTEANEGLVPCWMSLMVLSGERETGPGNFMLSYHQSWESRKFLARPGD